MIKGKTNAMRLLDKHKISYELHTYEAKEAMDGVTVASKIGRCKEMVFKTLVTRGSSQTIYVFVIPVEKELDLKKAAKVVKEKKIKMILVSEINALTGYVRGGCSPIGMKKNYQTVIDESAQTLPSFIVSGGKIGLQIEVNPHDLVNIIPLQFASLVVEND